MPLKTVTHPQQLSTSDSFIEGYATYDGKLLLEAYYLFEGRAEYQYNTYDENNNILSSRLEQYYFAGELGDISTISKGFIYENLSEWDSRGNKTKFTNTKINIDRNNVQTTDYTATSYFSLSEDLRTRLELNVTTNPDGEGFGANGFSWARTVYELPQDGSQKANGSFRTRDISRDLNTDGFVDQISQTISEGDNDPIINFTATSLADNGDYNLFSATSIQYKNRNGGKQESGVLYSDIDGDGIFELNSPYGDLAVITELMAKRQ